MWLKQIQADSFGVDRSPFGSFWFEPTGRLSGTGMRITAASSMGHPAVFACVRVLAESKAILPFRLLKPSADGKSKAQIRDHWLYRLMAKQPNRFQSPFEFREMLQGHLGLRGNAFSQITPDGRGGIGELLPLHPDRMKIELLDNGSYRYAYTAPNGQTIRYTRDEIWHLRGLSSDGYMGMSPIEVAREAVASGLSMQDYANRFFANDAKPGGGWIEFPGKFADGAAKQAFRESWQTMQGGSNRSKIAVLDKGMKFHELGLTNKDSQFIEARAANVSDIARIFRIPPHKIGDMSGATFSNIEQQAIEFWQDTMLPWTERWESSIETQLLGPDTDLEADFDMRRMMRGDSAARGAYNQSAILAGYKTRNEARIEDGDDPIPGLDKPLMPLNMATVDDDGDTEPPPALPDTDPALPPPKGKGAARLDAMLLAGAQRLARRAVGEVAKKGAAATFDAAFAEAVAQTLIVDAEKAQAFCEWAIGEAFATPGSTFEARLVDMLTAIGREP